MSAQLRPEFVAEVSQQARRNNESVVFVHTHPFSLNEFSEIDDRGEVKLETFINQRIPGVAHASMLLTPQRSIARELGQRRPLLVTGVGDKITWGEAAEVIDSVNHYERQIRAFGITGQQILASLRVGIVGLGGTGSIVLQQLVHLGVNNFVLLDPDTVEATNLNRLVGATSADVGRSKVAVAEKWASKINSQIYIEAKEESVLKSSVARSLAATDFVFCCTDSHGSRAVLNQLAYQYLVPVIDMGVVIATQRGHITHIAGRTQMLAPGIACMVCGNLLDSEQVRRDLLTDFERKADPYIVDETEPAPSVISLNSTMASLAITMFLNAVLGIPGSSRFLNYNAITGVCRPAFCAPHPSCIVCSSRGALARGDEWPLPGRQD
jgi:molybdopterin/thiamine biosynthesis adenylyltransferase